MSSVTNKIIIDLDGTLCPLKREGEDYFELEPVWSVVEKMKEYRERGFGICLYTARHMRTCEGDVVEITKNYSAPLENWLNKYGIPYDEIVFGKPWPGPEGFYVDDRTIRPSEFVELSSDEVRKLVSP